MIDMLSQIVPCTYTYQQATSKNSLGKIFNFNKKLRVSINLTRNINSFLYLPLSYAFLTLSSQIRQIKMNKYRIVKSL